MKTSRVLAVFVLALASSCGSKKPSNRLIGNWLTGCTQNGSAGSSSGVINFDGSTMTETDRNYGTTNCTGSSTTSVVTMPYEITDGDKDHATLKVTPKQTAGADLSVVSETLSVYFSDDDHVTFNVVSMTLTYSDGKSEESPATPGSYTITLTRQ